VNGVVMRRVLSSNRMNLNVMITSSFVLCLQMESSGFRRTMVSMSFLISKSNE
jgi:hypothetical protein